MSLLKRIQDSTLDKDCDVATLLRQCKVFGAQVASADLVDWVGRELNGYSDAAELPDYRRIRTTSKGHFSGPFGSGLQNVDIPIHCIPKEFREQYRHATVMQGVSALQATVENAKPSATLTLPWPSEAVALFGSDMYQNMNCVQAWKVLSVGAMRGVLDAVKTRVLDFTLELQRLHPELMTTQDPNATSASPQELKQTFNMTIYGSVGAIANASNHVAQHVTIHQGDKSALDQELGSHGVPPEGIAELHEAIKEDAANNNSAKTGLGPKVKQWLGSAVLKVTSGLWATSLDTAAKVLPPLVAGYIGVELK
jgi:hypothetical protein